MMREPTILLALAAALLLAGCANRTPVLDSRFGDAVRAARAQQTLNPDASRNLDPVNGLDGPAAKAAMDRYEKSFERPPAPVNVFNIGIGSSGGGSGK